MIAVNNKYNLIIANRVFMSLFIGQIKWINKQSFIKFNRFYIYFILHQNFTKNPLSFAQHLFFCWKKLVKKENNKDIQLFKCIKKIFDTAYILSTKKSYHCTYFFLGYYVSMLMVNVLYVSLNICNVSKKKVKQI